MEFRQQESGGARSSKAKVSTPASSLDWLVKNVVPAAALGVWFGESPAYKSFLALDLAFSVAHGRAWSGHDISPGSVIYIAGDNHRNFMRAEAWHRARGLKPRDADLIHVDWLPLAAPASIKTVVDAAAELNHPPGLIVVDGLSQLFGGTEDSRDAVTQNFRALRREFCDRFGSAVLIVHHSGHRDRHRPRGSAAISAESDFVYQVRGWNFSHHFRVDLVKRKGDFEPPALQFDLETIELRRDEDGDPVSTLTPKWRGANPGPVWARYGVGVGNP